MLRPLPRLLAPLGAVLVLGVCAARAEDPAAKAGGAKTVIELFTSQGCSSCPPADRLLGEYTPRPGIVALTLAVDYWDYLGWKDTLAKHGHTLRQKAYAKLRGDRKMFTPQIVVDGTAMTIGSDREAVDGAVAAASSVPKIPVHLALKGDRLTVTVAPRPESAGAAAASPAAELWLCPLASSQSVAIGRGENQGATMTYHNVVRRWIRLGTWTGGPATYEISLDDVRDGTSDAVAVLLQSGTQAQPGPILGADLQPLP